MENRIWLKGDTHLHTCNSDGKLTPGQLVEACQQAGLDYRGRPAGWRAYR